MNRLTKIDRYNHFYTNEKIYSRTNEFDCFDGTCINKLGQLEDIEEELGIDLITLFKALKNGCYIKNKITNTIDFKKVRLINILEVICFIPIDANIYTDQYIVLSDYGKTWALTKEELENGK